MDEQTLAEIERQLAIVLEFGVEERAPVVGTFFTEDIPNLIAALRTAQSQLAQERDKSERLEDLVAEWQASAMLSNASGDPDGITPTDNERNVNALMLELEQERERVKVLTEALGYITDCFSAYLYDHGELIYPDTHPNGGYWESIREANAALSAADEQKGEGRARML